jgi:hypothetical protein
VPAGRIHTIASHTNHTIASVVCVELVPTGHIHTIVSLLRVAQLPVSGRGKSPCGTVFMSHSWLVSQQHTGLHAAIFVVMVP